MLYLQIWSFVTKGLRGQGGWGSNFLVFSSTCPPLPRSGGVATFPISQGVQDLWVRNSLLNRGLELGKQQPLSVVLSFPSRLNPARISFFLLPLPNFRSQTENKQNLLHFLQL